MIILSLLLGCNAAEFTGVPNATPNNTREEATHFVAVGTLEGQAPDAFYIVNTAAYKGLLINVMGDSDIDVVVEMRKLFQRYRIDFQITTLLDKPDPRYARKLKPPINSEYAKNLGQYVLTALETFPAGEDINSQTLSHKILEIMQQHNPRAFLPTEEPIHTQHKKRSNAAVRLGKGIGNRLGLRKP